MATLGLLKKALRKELAARLERIPLADIETQSRRVLDHLVQLDDYKTSKNISVYISLPTCEIRTIDIIKHALDAGKSVYVPRCTKSDMDMVRILSWDDFLSLPVNKWQIPEPLLDDQRENALDVDGLDLILTPGFGFDKEKHRIGHGRGYYDKYFAKYQAWASDGKLPRRIALALEEQILPVGTIPVDQTDMSLDDIITASGIL